MSYNSGISVYKVYELGVSVWCLELAREVYPKLGWALVVGMVFIGLSGVVQGYIHIYIYIQEEEEVGTRVYPLPNYRFPRQHLRGAPQPSSPPSATGSSGVLE